MAGVVGEGAVARLVWLDDEDGEDVGDDDDCVDVEA
jgi:hypothetical protein